jgi:hypothetical protein
MRGNMITKFEKALLDPTSVYRYPMEVVHDRMLTKEQKIKILTQWEYDAKELQTAEEENMLELSEEKGSMLSRVLDAMHKLGEPHLKR